MQVSGEDPGAAALTVAPGDFVYCQKIKSQVMQTPLCAAFSAMVVNGTGYARYGT
jgi:hypothetical protein